MIFWRGAIESLENATLAFYLIGPSLEFPIPLLDSIQPLPLDFAPRSHFVRLAIVTSLVRLDALLPQRNITQALTQPAM